MPATVWHMRAGDTPMTCDRGQPLVSVMAAELATPAAGQVPPGKGSYAVSESQQSGTRKDSATPHTRLSLLSENAEKNLMGGKKVATRTCLRVFGQDRDGRDHLFWQRPVPTRCRMTCHAVIAFFGALLLAGCSLERPRIVGRLTAQDKSAQQSEAMGVPERPDGEKTVGTEDGSQDVRVPDEPADHGDADAPGNADEPGPATPGKGLLEGGPKARVVVLSDIQPAPGGDFDDRQSYVRFLLYSNHFDIEALGDDPTEIHRVIDAYERDFPNLRTWSNQYPSPESLRGKVFNGNADGIIEAARRDDPRPLWILVWGGIWNLAEALKKDPSIQSRIRVHSIGGANTEAQRGQWQAMVNGFPNLYWIEEDGTLSGMYDYFGPETVPPEYRGQEFLDRFVKGRGALGAYYHGQGTYVREGDSGTFLYLLTGNPDDPTDEHWGGRYWRPEPTARPNWFHDSNLEEDRYGEFAGARSILKWRKQALQSFAERLEWCRAPRP